MNNKSQAITQNIKSLDQEFMNVALRPPTADEFMIIRLSSALAFVLIEAGAMDAVHNLVNDIYQWIRTKRG